MKIIKGSAMEKENALEDGKSILKLSVLSSISSPTPFTHMHDLGKDDLYEEQNNEEEEDEEDFEDEQAIHIKGAYDPADFEHLQVPNEMKELFENITRYTPQHISLDTKLRPFIPEFIPSVGDIDAFIKVPRPDDVADKLGLITLDEPCANQSDSTILDLQLRAISKETTFKSIAVKSLENADKRPKEIDAWIHCISNLHQSIPPPTVYYSRNMPDLDTLLQEWPSEFEEALNQFGIPSVDLDCSLDDYIKIICAIMDIPIQRSIVQSLHVLFSLFLDFRDSQHFRSLIMNNLFEEGLKEY